MGHFTVLVVVSLLIWADYGNAQGNSNSSTISGLSRKDFPPGFIFGAGSSAVQHEGATQIDGKGLNVWDVAAEHPGKIVDGTSPDPAADQYHRYEKDVHLAKDMNLDSYRFSISWSRVLPEGRGKVNPKGVLYYNKLIDHLLHQGIIPFVTISHFDLPQAIADYGGWLSPKIIQDYRYFAKLCFDEFGDRVKHWVTLNEPHLLTIAGYLQGFYPPNHCAQNTSSICAQAGNSSTEVYLVGHYQLLAHAAGSKLYKKHYQHKQGGKIGITLDTRWYEPLTSSSDDAKAAVRAMEFESGWMINPIISGDYPPIMRSLVGNRLPLFTREESASLKKSIDFLGINHYSTRYATTSKMANQTDTFIGVPEDHNIQVTVSKNGALIGENLGGTYNVPWGMEKILLYFKQKYNNPSIWITENGCGDTNLVNLTSGALNDFPRIGYMNAYLTSLSSAIRKGAKVHGYYFWSFLDTWEFSRGLTIRYGLVFIDRQDDLKRYVKASGTWYKNFLAKH